MKKYGNYHDDLIKRLKDPIEASTYLTLVVEDGLREGCRDEDRKALLTAFRLALRDVAEAHGVVPPREK